MLTITLYNRYQNAVTGKEEWKRTLLSGLRERGRDAIHWQPRKGANVITSGLSSADAVLVLIWFSATHEDKCYLPPKAYAAVPPDKIGQYFTLSPGTDRLVKGVAPETSDTTRMNDIVARYDECITITSVDTKDFGSYPMRHFEVSGK